MSARRWYGFLLDRWDALRGSYWFFPAQMALLSGVVAMGAIEFDRRAPFQALLEIHWLNGVSAEGARSVLSTIAGSMMTVTGVVFSITVVALTLTSSQFGPRLLRTFLHDRSSQLALGAFLSTFCYSLLVLRAVESPERVPYVATAGAVALAIFSLFVLIFFIHHMASSLQASSVIAAVAREIQEQIPTLFPETLGEEGEAAANRTDGPHPDLDALDREGTDVRAIAEGYVRVLDDQAILRLACEHDLLIALTARPGAFVAAGSRIARIAPKSRVSDEVEAELRASCILGDHRTPVQDLSFLIQQLAEMAVRALSPGINDPKTAVECVDRIGGVMRQLAKREFPSGLRLDDEGTLRVVVEPTRFEDVAASCFDAMRRYGAGEPQVAIAMLEAIEGAAFETQDDERRAVLQDHAREIEAGFERDAAHRSERDRALVAGAFERASVALGATARRDRT